LESRNSHILFAKHLSILFVAILIVAIAGFYSSYFKYFPFLNGEISASVHIHAIFMMLWLMMLITQPLLVVLGKRELHRKLGNYSWILVVSIVFSSLLLIIERYNLDSSKNIPLISNLAIRLFSVITIFTFVTFYFLALKNKSNIAVHTRYIIGTGLTVVPASATRLLYFLKVNSILAEFTALLIINALVVSLIIRDKRSGVVLKERPYFVILGVQMFLTIHYLLLLSSTMSWR